MRTKSWIIIVLLGTVVSLTFFAAVMYLLDPFVQYRLEDQGPLTYYEYAENYSNPGIAKNYEYDSVMVGTSMIENTDVDLCDKLFDCNMVRLSYSGGTTYNMKRILDICFQSKNDIDSVYWELDEFQLFGSATEPRYKLPEYLYRMDHKEDLSYLLNLDIFYHYALKDMIATLQGKVQPAERRGIMLEGEYNKNALLKNYTSPETAEEKIEFNNSVYKKKEDANLQNIIELAVANPKTKFVFFLPPFSVLYWDRELRLGHFDLNMDGLEYAVKKLLTYDNISIYFYHGEKDIISDLDNYKDYSHYGPWINDKITEYIADGRGRLTEENYMDLIDDFRNYIHSYDYESILAGE